MGKTEKTSKQTTKTGTGSKGFKYRERRGMYSSLVTLALIFMFFYVMTGIKDPIEVYDGFLQFIQIYSKSVAWVQDAFTILIVKPKQFQSFIIDKINLGADSVLNGPIFDWISDLLGGSK